MKYFRFGLFGGLGDIIYQSYSCLPYICHLARSEKVVIIVGNFYCSGSFGYFENLPENVIVIKATDICPNREKLRRNYEMYERQFFIREFRGQIMKLMIPGECPSLSRSLIPDRELSARGRELVDLTRKNKTLLIGNIARGNSRSISGKEMIPIIARHPGFRFIQIGSSERPEPFCIDRDDVLCAINETTISDAIALIDSSSKLACADSALMCYGLKTRKPMDIVIRNRRIPKYGLSEETRPMRKPYFDCFDFPTTTVYDLSYQKLN